MPPNVFYFYKMCGLSKGLISLFSHKNKLWHISTICLVNQIYPAKNIYISIKKDILIHPYIVFNVNVNILSVNYMQVENPFTINETYIKVLKWRNLLLKYINYTSNKNIHYTNLTNMDAILGFAKQLKIFLMKFSNLFRSWLGGVKKIYNSNCSSIANLAFSSTASASNATYKQNFSKLNHAFGHFSIKYIWQHLKTTLLTLISERKYWGKFENKHGKPEFSFLLTKWNLWKNILTLILNNYILN